MRHVCIVLTTILLLLLSLIIVLGDEAFATTESPNMTLTEPPSGFTPVQNVSTPISLEQLAMSAPPSNISQQLQQQRQLSLQHPLSSLQPPLVSLVPERTDFTSAWSTTTIIRKYVIVAIINITTAFL